MQKALAGMKAAILVANGFNETEMTVFQRGMMEAGATPKIVSSENSLANGWQGTGWGHYFAVDCKLPDALSADFDFLIIPGGMRSLEKLKLTAHTKRFIGGFLAAMKPIMLIGDAGMLLSFTGQAQGLMMTSAVESKEALTAAGVIWSDNSPTIHNAVMSISSGLDAPALVEQVETLVNFVAKEAAEAAEAEAALEQQAA